MDQSDPRLDAGRPHKDSTLTSSTNVSLTAEVEGAFWQNIKIWEKVTDEEFLSYRWQVSGFDTP